MELLERDHILDEIRELLRQAAAGHGRLLLLGGEAGVGKTVLLRQIRDYESRPSRVLLGNCDPLSTPRALGPLFDFDEPALNRPLIENAPREVIFRTALEILVSGARPTLLIVEDIHWADEATLDFLRYVGRRIASTRVLAIASFRDDEIGPGHRLGRFLDDLAPLDGVHRLHLEPLSVHSVAALAEHSGIDAAALYDQTRGNPFFVTEILAAGGDIPPNVRDAVLSRGARLNPSAWAVLEAAAVIGSPIDRPLLQHVANPAPAEVEACLNIGMLRQDGGTLHFRHELSREAILSEVSPVRRSTLHAKVLKALEANPATRRNFALLAHHAEAAGDRMALLRHAPKAARRAMQLRAHGEAANHFDRALHFVSELPDRDRALLLEDASHAYYLTGRINRAKAALAEAVALWSQLGDRRKEGENRCHLAILHWADAHMEEAEREVTRAVALLEPLSPGAELALAYRTFARLRGTILDDEEAIHWGEQAIAIAETLDIPETLVDALITVGVARLARGDFPRGQSQLERAIALSTAAGLDDLTARAHANLGFGFDEHYQFAPAALHYERGVQFCVERDLDNSRLHMSAWLARCHVFLGNWAEAFSLANSVLEAKDIAPVTQFVALLVAGMVRTRRGDPDAGPLLDEALVLAEASGSLYRLGPVRAARAEAAYLRGDRAGTVAEAEAAYELALQQGQRWYAGELAYWRRQGGDPAPPPAAIAPPFAAQLAGDWAAAAAAWDALACPYEAARARAESTDEPALRHALATFDRLGARPAASRLRTRMRALGLRGVPRGPRPATRAHPAGLTAREVEVARLLAAGAANAAIAARLFLSPRTVENHVAAIYAKLGATTRPEAMSAARRLGLLPQSE